MFQKRGGIRLKFKIEVELRVLCKWLGFIVFEAYGSINYTKIKNKLSMDSVKTIHEFRIKINGNVDSKINYSIKKVWK
jgi:hypothetical protein